MSAFWRADLFLKWISPLAVPLFPTLLSTLFLLPFPLVAQTSLDDVHVVPRSTATASVSASASTGLVSGSLGDVIHKDVNLVLVPVSVTDPQQRLVTGLSRDNFQVFDGKKSQEIRHFSSEDAPVSIGLVVDTSGSMKDKMERVHEAVKEFCEASNPQDEFFLITFADAPQLVQDFTDSPSEIENKMIFARSKGSTALLDAIYLGLAKMRQAKYSKKALLFISDGGDNHSRYGEWEVKKASQEADTAIYAIGTYNRYVPTQEEWLGPYLLAHITEPTGGRAFTIADINDLPDVAHRVGVELRVQYVLGYRPIDAPRNGKWHKIRVKLRLPRKLALLQAHAKSGYYAPAE
jgi:Ca-activated chloride channel family protein